MKKRLPVFLVVGLCLLPSSCGIFSTTYHIAKGTVKTTYGAAKLAVKAVAATGRLTYKIGGYTYEVVKAPFAWPLTSDIESIGGLSPKEAIRLGRVKNAPYVVKGKRYKPMSVAAAAKYKEKGLASWYGYETRNMKGGHMTANGEAFDPRKPSAAHKYLPLPVHVRVKNLENGRSLIVRVNDRGPFVSGRIIDLSAGAAKKLGFYKQGMARVLVETVEID